MSKSKNKGTAFESKVCTMLNEKFAGHNGVPRPFIRNAGSGGIFGGKHASKMNGISSVYKMVGDIVPPDDGMFRFVIECKHYKDPPTLKSIVCKKSAEWDKWISQVESDARAISKFPMLVIKYNNIPEIVFITEKFEGRDYPCPIPREKIIMSYNAKNALYQGLTLEDFLSLEKSFFFDEPLKQK